MTSPVNSAHQSAVDDEMRLEKNAGLVMATNNSSIVSKRSVEKLYLPEPHFFRYFVKKPVRRAPTINRGYWLRMHAVDWVVRRFLEKPSEQKKVVINLGCGYDPLPFQWLARYPALCANSKFIDVDYELLMETKREIIRDTPKMNNLLHPYNDEAMGSDPSVLIDSEEYAAVGCDLRNLPRLGRLLRHVVNIDDCLVLCVAEVSITYMQTEAADALIAWSSTISPDVTFCLLEQCSPDQFDNPFTMTMMKHFAKLGTPLRSVQEYPGAHGQIQRFREAGFINIDYHNLWELWSDPRFLSPSQRVALDHVEPFDEWEEFALFASHYCLVVAHNRDAPLLAQKPRSRRDSTVSISSDISARTSSPHKPSNEWFAYHYNKEPGDLCQRHHASAYMIPDQDAIGVHGGIGTRARLATTAVVRPRHYKDDPPITPPLEIGARCCHTVTPMDGGQNFLVGGRGSPSSVYKDCWLQTGQTWERVHDLPTPRYRHRVVPIILPDNSSGAICFGGKTDPINVASDVLLWEPTKGWRTLRTNGPDPVPRFGPIFLRLGYNHGLLFGGMRQDGVICQGFWRWRLRIRNNEVVHIDFRTSNAIDASAGTWPWFARFGGSYSMQRDEVLIIGGVAKSGCIPKPYEILSLIGCFSNYKEAESEMPLRIACVAPTRAPGCPRPFLVGHSTHRTRSGLSITLGGGATCFSFGNYFNTGIWVLYDREAGLSTDWIIVPSKHATLAKSNEVKEEKLLNGNSQENLVEQVRTEKGQGTTPLARFEDPRIIQGLDFGPCIKKWSLQYLKEKIPVTREVVVHDSQTRAMNFQRKDFAYRKLPFQHFLNMLNDTSSHLYLRSLATENPSSALASLKADWPEIEADFRIPSQLQDIENNLHSSPLRISNNASMWLHYDVMANVLFQIKGIKKLVLFPPSDLPRLHFPPGSTTSDLDIFNSELSPGDVYGFKKPDGTSPVVAMLQPGDALCIPALWSHTGISVPICEKEMIAATNLNINASSRTDSHLGAPIAPSAAVKSQTLDQSLGHTVADAASTAQGTRESNISMDPLAENPFLSIAVNTFFRSFPAAAYAAGRDVYGNRDLACYEDGRKMIKRIVARFKNSQQQGQTEASEQVPGSSSILDWVPRDIRKSYLLRLAKELEQNAETL